MGNHTKPQNELIARKGGRPPGTTLGKVTDLQGQIIRLRVKGLSFPAIAQQLNIDVGNCQRYYTAGLKHMGLDVPKKLAEDLGVGPNDFRRMEHTQAVEVATRAYWEVIEGALGRKGVDKDGERFDWPDASGAVAALNGLRGWVEMAIKLHGVAAPEQHQHQVVFTPQAIDAEILRLQAEIDANSRVIDSDLDPQ